jgi:acyl carrier protein
MTSIPDLETQIRQILVTRLGLPTEEVTLAARLQEDLGVDSLDAVEMAIAIERQFDVGLSDEQVASVKTVGDMVALVQRLADQRPGRTR